MIRAKVALAVLLGACSFGALAQTQEVSPELWDRPRSAEAVAGEANVRRAVLQVLADPEARLVIRHAAGQEPLLHAEELRSWLGALAIDTRRISVRSDLAPGAPLQLEVAP